MFNFVSDDLRERSHTIAAYSIKFDEWLIVIDICSYKHFFTHMTYYRHTLYWYYALQILGFSFVFVVVLHSRWSCGIGICILDSSNIDVFLKNMRPLEPFYCADFGFLTSLVVFISVVDMILMPGLDFIKS